MILPRNRSCAWVRIKEGANAENHEEDGESMRLEVDQRNHAISRIVEWFQDSMLEVTTLEVCYHVRTIAEPKWKGVNKL